VRIAGALATILVAVLVAVLVASQSHASGLSTARFGGEHGHVLTDNATAIYYNPAGIAESEGGHVFVDGVVAYRSARYFHARAEGEIPEPPDALGANYGEAKFLSVGGSPMLGGTFKIGDVGLGLASYIPIGGGSGWSENPQFERHPRFPGAVDGAQRWFAIAGLFNLVYVSAAVAYRIEPARLSLGVSGSFIYGLVDTIRAQSPNGTNDLGTEGRTLLSANGMYGGFGAGAIWEALPERLWIAASYQSRPNVAGGMKLEGSVTLATGAGMTETPAQLEQDLADIIRFGIRYAATRTLELRFFGDVSRWSALSSQCVSQLGVDCHAPDPGGALPPGVIAFAPRNWHDAFGLRFGMSYWPHPILEVFSGIGYDSTAVPAATLDPALPDFHDMSCALGARVRVAAPVHVALGYTHLFSAFRDTRGRSELTPDAGGVYWQTTGVVDTNLDVAF